MRIVGWVLGVLGALYAAVTATAFLQQRAVMYPAPAANTEPRVPGATLERIAGPRGTTIYALYAPAPPGAPTVVHFHGNGEDLAGQGAIMQLLRDAGVGVFAVEYPGYG